MSILGSTKKLFGKAKVTELSVAPSFRANFGHDPVPGEDYDPDGDLCQDDYEYYTGTGRYSHTPPQGWHNCELCGHWIKDDRSCACRHYH